MKDKLTKLGFTDYQKVVDSHVIDLLYTDNILSESFSITINNKITLDDISCDYFFENYYLLEQQLITIFTSFIIKL